MVERELNGTTLRFHEGGTNDEMAVAHTHPKRFTAFAEYLSQDDSMKVFSLLCLACAHGKMKPEGKQAVWPPLQPVR